MRYFLEAVGFMAFMVCVILVMGIGCRKLENWLVPKIEEIILRCSIRRRKKEMSPQERIVDYIERALECADDLRDAATIAADYADPDDGDPAMLVETLDDLMFDLMETRKVAGTL